MARAEQPSAASWVPAHPTLPVLIRASKGCRGCHLYENATQTVFGAGPAKARVIMVGEQPGDQEDMQGEPFVGPAGKLLDKAMVEAEIDRSLVYVTNAVKHFKFEPRGKRRIHQKPNSLEINACYPWLEAEMEVIRPEVVVCLGATAAQALLGRSFRLTQHRGEFFPHPQARCVTATIHPSALLRMPEPERRHEEFAHFVEDLRRVHSRGIPLR
jgi:DNA polymerase